MAIYEFTDKFQFLSNFHESSVEYDGEIYPTVEHAYQAAKTTNKTERAIIRNAPTAAKAKKLGRQVTLRSDWNNLKDDIMLYLLYQKFSKEPLKSQLLATGNHYIEEGNWWGDRYWGVSPERSGIGQNKLGILLMIVRSHLMNEDKF